MLRISLSLVRLSAYVVAWLHWGYTYRSSLCLLWWYAQSSCQ